MIYVLLDPREGYQEAYVGMTIDMERRYKQHLSEAKRMTKVSSVMRRNITASERFSWIARLLAIGLKPTMICIDEEEKFSESAWIKALSHTNFLLVNSKHDIENSDIQVFDEDAPTEEDVKASVSGYKDLTRFRVKLTYGVKSYEVCSYVREERLRELKCYPVDQNINERFTSDYNLLADYDSFFSGSSCGLYDAIVYGPLFKVSKNAQEAFIRDHMPFGVAKALLEGFEELEVVDEELADAVAVIEKQAVDHYLFDMTKEETKLYKEVVSRSL